MSEIKDHIDVELEEPTKDKKKDDEDIIVERSEDKSAEKKTIDPDEGINDLKNKLLEEQKKRFEAENRARDAIQKQYKAQTETEETNYVLVKSAIKTVRGENDVLKSAYKDALAIGDYDKAAEIQDKLTENKLRLAELKKGREYMKAQRQQVRNQAPQVQMQADPVEAVASQLSARSADWVRRNPQFVTDPRLYQKMVAAHNLVTADGVQPDSDEYFDRVETTLNMRRAPEPEREEQDAMSEAAKPAQRRAPPPAAPVSRSGGSTRQNVVRLTRDEAEAARDMGMTEQEYARNKLLLKKEGRI
jgi:hypothetical protein